MLRLALALAVVGSPAALADVGPRPAPCNVQGLNCQTCVENLAQPGDGACAAAALDAGLKLSDCTDRVGTQETRYYCPSNVTVARQCGCSAGAGGLVALAGVLVLGVRRRAR